MKSFCCESIFDLLTAQVGCFNSSCVENSHKYHYGVAAQPGFHFENCFYCLLLFQIIMCCTLFLIFWIIFEGRIFINLVVLTLGVSFWNELRIDRTKQCCSLTFNGNIQPLVDTHTLSLSLFLFNPPPLFFSPSLSLGTLFLGVMDTTLEVQFDLLENGCVLSSIVQI